MSGIEPFLGPDRPTRCPRNPFQLWALPLFLPLEVHAERSVRQAALGLPDVARRFTRKEPMGNHLRILVLLVAAPRTAACDEGLTNIAGPTPNLEPTFSSIQRDIFENADS